MKKIATALVVASAAVFGFGLAASAVAPEDGQRVSITSGTVTSGGSYTVTYFNCNPGSQITFTQADSTPAELSAVCVAPSSGSDFGDATVTFDAAPLAGTSDATFTGTAGGGPERSPTLPFSFVIPGQATTTTPTTAAPTTVAPTTAAPTTVAPTTVPASTVAPTLPDTGESGAGTAAPAVTVPPTTPTGELPATGSDGVGVTTTIAIGLLVVGLGLLVVAQVRRRQPTSV